MTPVTFDGTKSANRDSNKKLQRAPTVNVRLIFAGGKDDVRMTTRSLCPG